MSDKRRHSQTSNIVRFLLKKASDGQGLTGLTHSSTGLRISTITDNEAAATAYTEAGSTIETITTLATFATPTATKCRFKEVDSTNHPGLYEFQFANARFSVAGAKQLVITVTGVSDLSQADYLIELDPPVNLSAINNDQGGVVGFNRATKAITTGVVDSGATTTVIPTVSTDPPVADADQFKGLILAFDKDTASDELQGQKTDILANDVSGVLTVTALTKAPASGDTFCIE